MAKREFILEKVAVVQCEGYRPFYLSDSWRVGVLAAVRLISSGIFRLVKVQKEPPEIVIPKEYC